VSDIGESVNKLNEIRFERLIELTAERESYNVSSIKKDNKDNYEINDNKENDFNFNDTMKLLKHEIPLIKNSNKNNQSDTKCELRPTLASLNSNERLMDSINSKEVSSFLTQTHNKLTLDHLAPFKHLTLGPIQLDQLKSNTEFALDKQQRLDKLENSDYCLSNTLSISLSE